MNTSTQPTTLLSRNVLAIAALVLAISGCGGEGAGGVVDVSSPYSSTSPPPSLGAGIDAVVKPFMASNGITAVTVTVVKNGQVLYDQGYGFQDPAQTIPLPANALMVTASIVKPVTGAAIQKLAAAGILSLYDHAFCNGHNAPCWLSADLLSASSDPRAGDITIAELLAMTAGFDRDKTAEPLSEESVIQATYHLTTPPQRTDDIRYRMAQPLDTEPGATYSYSNFGYLVLGQIIEQASQMSYTQYVDTTVMAPLGVASSDFIAAASLLKDHSPREPNYLCDNKGPSVYAPGTTVQLNDGVINTDNWVSVGFSVTTSKAMALFASTYTIDAAADNGAPLTGPASGAFWHGEYCGTQTIVGQRSSGVGYAVLMNKSSPGYTSAYASDLQSQIDYTLALLGM